MRRQGSMHTLALRRCAPLAMGQASPWQRLGPARPGRPGAGRAVRAVEGSDPRATRAWFGRGAVRIFTRTVPLPPGVAPLEISLQEGSVSALRGGGATRSTTARPAGWRASSVRGRDSVGLGPQPPRQDRDAPVQSRFDAFLPRTDRPERPAAGDGKGMPLPITPDATPGVQTGSLRSQPQAPARHSRSNGCGATETQPPRCGIVGVSPGREVSCPPTPNVGWALPARPRTQPNS